MKEKHSKVVADNTLWETMRKKSVAQSAFIQAGVDRRIPGLAGKNKNVAMLTLEKVYAVLDCTLNEVVRFAE